MLQCKGFEVTGLNCLIRTEQFVAFLAPPASPEVEPRLDQHQKTPTLARIAETMSYIQTCACARPPFRRFLTVQTQRSGVLRAAHASCSVQYGILTGLKSVTA